MINAVKKALQNSYTPNPTVTTNSYYTTNTRPSTTQSFTFQPSTSTFNTNGSRCPQDGVFYPNYSTGCQKFYVCAYTGTQYEKITDYSCPPGLLFDPQMKACNYAHLVSC